MMNDKAALVHPVGHVAAVAAILETFFACPTL